MRQSLVHACEEEDTWGEEEIYSLPGLLQRLRPSIHWSDKENLKTGLAEHRQSVRRGDDRNGIAVQVQPPHWLGKSLGGTSDPWLLEEEDCRSHPHLTAKSHHEFGLWTSVLTSIETRPQQTAVLHTVSRLFFHFFTNFLPFIHQFPWVCTPSLLRILLI